MDETEAISVNSTCNIKCNDTVDVATEGINDKSQVHISKHSSTVSVSSIASELQNLIAKQNCKSPNSNTLRPIRSVPLVSSRPEAMSLSQNDSLNVDSKNLNKLLIDKRTFLGTRRKSSPVNAISAKESDASTRLQNTENFHVYEPIAPSVTKEIVLPAYNEHVNLSIVQNSSDTSLGISPQEDTDFENKYQKFSSSDKTKDVQSSAKQTYEIDSQSTLICSELENTKQNIDDYEKPLTFPENGTSLVKDDGCGSPDNQSLKSFESRVFSPDDEESKVEMCRNNSGSFDDTSNFDDSWMNYLERPLLPLKPLQKQKSVSCSSLVQTIKGLSKRKNSNNRFLPPENIFVQSKEICTSEADISKALKRKQSRELAEKNLPRVSDVDESFEPKNIRQSFQYFTWYHVVDGKEASKRLLAMRQNGAFLIRPASNPTPEVLHTLCVTFSGRVYNFHVRNLENGHMTLGRRKHPKKTFSSLLDMIKYHQSVPIPINFACEEAHVYLLITPSK